MAESEQGTGWHMRPCRCAERGHMHGAATCDWIDGCVPVLVVPVGEVRETIARAIAEHRQVWGDVAFDGYICACGWPGDDLRHTFDELLDHQADAVLAALAATPPETEETRS